MSLIGFFYLLRGRWQSFGDVRKEAIQTNRRRSVQPAKAPDVVARRINSSSLHRSASVRACQTYSVRPRDEGCVIIFQESGTWANLGNSNEMEPRVRMSQKLYHVSHSNLLVPWSFQVFVSLVLLLQKTIAVSELDHV